MKNLITGVCIALAVLSGCRLKLENDRMRINQVDYLPNGVKVAVWCSKEKENKLIHPFELIDTANQVVFTGKPGNTFGDCVAFQQTQRLDFSKLNPCSNNLTVSFAMPCYWYQPLTGVLQFIELEQATLDWLFGCNPWGTNRVYSLPKWGNTPTDPHSFFPHLKNYPLDGGLADGPIYAATFTKLSGLKLYHPDSYAPLQSSLTIYPDEQGDYSTNGPTMAGTASLIYLPAVMEGVSQNKKTETARGIISHGAIIRADTTKKALALIFTGHEFADGWKEITQALKDQQVKASFFFTGDFYRNKKFYMLISQLKKDGHYLGAHSDKHLLYADWDNRDSLLVTKQQFKEDLLQNYSAMKQFGISKNEAAFFLPPFEWYNLSISSWTEELGLQLINYTPGTISFADYTWPELPGYKTSEEIYQSIITFERTNISGLNGFLLLSHIGTDPRRTDKFYHRISLLLTLLKQKGYCFKRVNEILGEW